MLRAYQAFVIGNSHFPFADTNNQQIVELMADWFKRKNLDAYTNEKPRDKL